MGSEKIVTYQPEIQLKMGFWALWKEMFLEIIHCRELTWRLFLRDFQAKYKQSLLGITWTLINPLITLLIFVFLSRSGLMNIETTETPYAAFALVGLTIWVIFSNGIVACTNSIVSAGDMVVKINFPKISLVIASMGQTILELLIRIALTAAVFAFLKVTPSKMTLLFPILILPVFFLTIGLGCFFALFACLFRDTVNLVTLSTTYLLFLMPVVYPPPPGGILSIINNWNPLQHIITSVREIVLYGSISNLESYLWSSVFCFVLFLISWWLFYLVVTKIPERI